MEKNPWWQNVSGPYPTWEGPTGVKADGGGSIRGQGRVGRMLMHRAVCNRDKEGKFQFKTEFRNEQFSCKSAACMLLHQHLTALQDSALLQTK